MSQPAATILVAEIRQRPGTEGAEYVIRLPDGREASIWDGDPDYWAIADAIDTAFPSEGGGAEESRRE